MAVLAAGSGNNLVTSATRASFSTTVAGWFKLSSLGAGSQSLVACGSTTNVIASNVDATSGLSMLVNSTPTTSYTAPLTPGKWYWIGFRIDSSGNATTFIGSLRRDGTAVVYFGNTVTAANVTTVLRLFTDHNGGFSLAAAENVMVWASARTDQQIADAAVLGYDPVVAGTSPWAWWKLANSTDLSDYSGNARGLTLNGSISTVSGPTATPSWGSGTSVAVKCCGNSITAGYDHSPIPPTYPSTLASLRPTFTVQNLGHDGAGTLSLLAENDLFYSVGYDNIVLFSESINDASYGPDDTTTCLAKIASYVRFAHALGFDCIIGTVLPYNNNSGFGFTNPTATDGVNTALRGGAIQGADYLADNGADSYWSNPNDTAVFRDGAHPTDVGYAHLAGNWNTALTAYLATLNLAINTQPTDQFASVAGSATFSVSATASAGSLTYQWRRRQTSTGTPTNIGGATSSSYTRSTLSIADSGWYYDCVVTDSNGSATTSLARLVLVFSADAFLYAGESNATDVKLRDPTAAAGGGAMTTSAVGIPSGEFAGMGTVAGLTAPVAGGTEERPGSAIAGYVNSPAGGLPEERQGAAGAIGASAPAGGAPEERPGSPAAAGFTSAAGTPSAEAPGATSAAALAPTLPAGQPTDEHTGAAVAAGATQAAGVASTEASGATSASALATASPSGQPTDERSGTTASSATSSPTGHPATEFPGAPAAAALTTPAGARSTENPGAATDQATPSPAGQPASEAPGSTSCAALASPVGAPSAETAGTATAVQGVALTQPAGEPSREAQGSAAASTATSLAGGRTEESAGAATAAQGLVTALLAGTPSTETTGAIVSAVAASPAGQPALEQSGAAVVSTVSSPAGLPSTEATGPLVAAVTAGPVGARTTEVAGAAAGSASASPAGTTTEERAGAGAASSGGATSTAGATSDERGGAAIAAATTSVFGSPTTEAAGASSLAVALASAGSPSTEWAGVLVSTVAAALAGAESQARVGVTSLAGPALLPVGVRSDEKPGAALSTAATLTFAAGARSQETPGAASTVGFTAAPVVAHLREFAKAHFTRARAGARFGQKPSGGGAV